MLQKQDYFKNACKCMLIILCSLSFTSIGLAQSWTSKAPMPTARGWLSTSVVNNNIYAIGGATAIGSNLDAVEAYDPLTNTWTTKTPMPTPRGCAAACAVDGIIYVFGGGWYTVYSTVEAYDPSNDTWTEKSPMPTARSGLSVCEVDGIIYAISGFTDMNNAIGTNAVEAYDPKTDTWTTKASIPTPRAYFTISVVDGIIYAITGFNRISAPSLGNVEAYDPVSDVWTVKNNMPDPRAGMACYTVGGNIYCFGGVGHGGGACHSTISKYDPASDNWGEFSNMPYAAFSISSSLVNEKLYLIGGLNDARTPLDIVYEYKPPQITNIEEGNVSGTWTKANSPYNINGEITIPNDSTLTIEPGVKVVFTGHYEFNIHGRLLAIGTEIDTIVFTIHDTTGFHNLNIPDGGWGGIKREDIGAYNDSTIFEYCRFQYGKVYRGNGGAIYSEVDKLRISHSLFRNNLCFSNEPFSGTGGAISIRGGKPIIEYCEFCWNKSFYSGSALAIVGSALIRNNHFHHNNSSAPIAIYLSASPIFINNLIEQNHSYDATIIYFSNDGANAKIINNTIVNNTCSQGAILVNDGSPVFINNIIYGNEPSQVYFDTLSSSSFYNCLIEGGKEGFAGATFTGTYENCIDADPQFVSSNDYGLQNTSPCIGAGIDSILIGSQWYCSPSTDFEGNPRPNPSGSMPDMGALENPFAVSVHTDIPAGDVSGTWTKSNSPYYINGEITIPNDSTLSIEPGVDVVFTGHYKFNVQGRLLAIGTETDTILFTIKDTTGYHDLTLPDGGWHGIRFIDTPSNNDSSKIVYSKLEYGKANTGAGYHDRWGGAICAKINKLLVSHCMFRNNSCYHPDLNNNGGGAIALVGDPIIEFCEFTENRSSWGSAMLIWGSNLYPLIRNNYFHHNLGHGTINIGSWSGINTSPMLINNIIADNISNGNGPITSGHGIIHISTGGGIPVLINNTFVNNSSTVSGGAIFVNDNISPLLINNIIYGNKPSQVNFLSKSNTSFKNCLIEGGKEGFTGAAFTGTYENCIDDNPQFVSTNEYRLENSSPCIGNGIDSIMINNNMYYCPSTDFDGNPRPNPLGSMPDIGACENERADPITDIKTETNQLPTKFALAQNYPNPFNPSTTIKYCIPSGVNSQLPAPTQSGSIVNGEAHGHASVRLVVYDVLGREVAILVNEKQTPGNYAVEWNAANLPSGVYFYQLTVGEYIETKKLVLLK